MQSWLCTGLHFSFLDVVVVIISSVCRENRAPVVFTNAIGRSEWSGLYEYQFTSLILSELNDFIRFEAHRRGYNESRTQRHTENPFHSSFLDGRPKQYWNKHYQIGLAVALVSN